MKIGLLVREGPYGGAYSQSPIPQLEQDVGMGSAEQDALTMKESPLKNLILNSNPQAAALVTLFRAISSNINNSPMLLDALRKHQCNPAHTPPPKKIKSYTRTEIGILMPAKDKCIFSATPNPQ
ncbi:hypothetical protein EMCRGX_G012806 [Ephydatia muelleri]